MYLRYTADRRTLAWAVAMPVVALIPYLRPELVVWLFPLSCYLALSAGVIAHNHNHCPTFRDRKLNGVFGNWLSHLLRVPHLRLDADAQPEPPQVREQGGGRDHHLALHQPPQRAGGRRPTSSSPATTRAIRSRPTSARRRSNNPALYRQIVRQYVVLGGAHLALLALAVALHGLRARGSGCGCFAVRHPGVLRAVDDHVLQLHPARPHRSLERAQPLAQLHGPAAQLPALQQRAPRRAPRDGGRALEHAAPSCTGRWRREIDPRLNERSFWWFCLKNYVLAPFFPSLGTKQIGRAPFDDPGRRASSPPRSPPRWTPSSPA